MPTSADERFMRLAIARAHEGVANGQSPFGACVVKDGAAVSCEHNVVWRTTDITAHAEIHAIRVACARLRSIDLSGCVIYSTCEPCPMCFSACHWSHAEAIVFGASIADAQALGFGELTISNATMRQLGGSRLELIGGVLRDECLGIFRAWQAAGRSRVY